MTYRTATLAALVAALMAGPPVLAQTTDEGEKSEAAEKTETGTDAAIEDKETEASGETSPTNDATNDDAAPAEVPATVAIEDLSADTVVMTINGTDITLAELIAVRQGLPDQYQSLPDEILMGALTQQLADQQMLADAAIAKGLEKSSTVQLALKNLRRATLADAYMTDELVNSISDEAIAKTYDEKYASIEPVIEVRASHILVAEEALALDLKKQLDEGAEFAALAAEHGTDGTKTRGGDLGYFVKEQMVPEFADAAFALEKGQISDPVKSPFGWHLIYLADKREKPAPPLEEVRDEIVQEMSTAMQEKIITEGRATAAIVQPEVAIPPAAIRLDNLLAE